MKLRPAIPFLPPPRYVHRHKLPFHQTHRHAALCALLFAALLVLGIIATLILETP